MRVRSIALLSLLSIIPLSANDELVDPVQNDILTVHEDEMKASTQEIIADESVAADTDKFAADDSENDDEGVSSTNQQAQHEIVRESTEDEQDVKKNKITGTSDDTEKSEATENNIEQNIQEPSNLDKQETTEPAENKSKSEDSTEETNEIDQDETAGNQGEVEEKASIEAQDSNETDTAPSSDQLSENVEENEDKANIAIDYSSKSTGALIIDKSKNFQGTSNLLNPDKDKYAMIPCDQGDAVKYVTIGLSEDILVKTIKLVSNERYSSLTKRFQVLGSQDMSTWEDMGTFDAKPWYKENKQQTFELESPSWARYLKFKFLDHYGDEHYCAYTQISVFGSTTLQGYQEMQMEANEAAEAESEAAKAVVDEIQNAALGELENLESDDSTNEINIPDEELEPGSEENSDAAETESSSAENESVDISEKDQSTDAKSATVVEDKKPEVEETDTEVKEQKAHTTEDSSAPNDVKVEIPESKSIEEATEQSDEIPVELEPTEKLENNNEVVEKSKVIPQVKYEVASGESADQTKPPESEIGTDSKSAKEKEDVVSSAPVASTVKSVIQSVRKPTTKESIKETNNEDVTQKPEMDKGKDYEDSEISEEVEADEKSEPKPADEDSTTNVTDEVKKNTEEVTEPEPPTVQTAKTLEDTPEESQPPKLNSSSTYVSSVPTNIDSSSNDVVKATEEILRTLSKKYPNAKCLNYLDFSEFKKRSIESAKQKLSTGDKTKIQGNKNEPIFKKLTDEIKGLQASQGVYEQYIKAATSCYQRVILDLGNDIVLKQKEHEDRVTAIEDQMKQFLHENQSNGLGFKDLIHGTKSTLKPLYNFLIRTFPVLVSCYQYLKIIFLSTFEKILENEHVQKALALLQSYERDIKTFVFGMLCCYVYFLSTSAQKKPKSKESKKRRRVPRITAPQHTPQKIHGLVVQNGEILSSPSLHDDRSD